MAVCREVFQLKRNQLTPVIEANNIEDFIQLIIVAASLRRDARLNDFLREEADIARVTWAKTEPAFVRNILNLIRKADDPQAVILNTYEHMRVPEVPQ